MKSSTPGIAGSWSLHSWVRVLVFFCTACLAQKTVYALTAIPELKDPVTDTAQILSPNTRLALNTSLKKLWKSGGSQLAVLTIDQLEQDTIESYAIRVAEAWKLGTSDKDNGILLVIAKTDRKVRIEVGQGLEGVLPDAYASRIIRNVITPAFKRGQFDYGVHQAVVAIITLTDETANISELFSSGGLADGKLRPGVGSARGALVNLLPFLFFILMSILAAFLRGVSSGSQRSMYRRSGYFGHHSGYGGGGGFRGGSGGGFFGGGGGFSGGGASGDW